MVIEAPRLAWIWSCTNVSCSISPMKAPGDEDFATWTAFFCLWGSCAVDGFCIHTEIDTVRFLASGGLGLLNSTFHSAAIMIIWLYIVT